MAKSIIPQKNEPINKTKSVNKRHGLSKTPIYKVWKRMKGRCYCKTDSSYDQYGGRGISICDEWVNDPVAFCQWAMANGWERGLYIDRIEVEKGYSRDNCRFIDKNTSMRNTQLLAKHNKSGYRGVSSVKGRNKWNAQIQYNGKIQWLGHFDNPIAAAKAYDKRAKELDSAYPLNFSNGGI